MSQYKNFIEDFPNRCGDLLLLAYEKAVANDREVTLSLMVAAAGLLVPFERLRPDGQFVHPADDRGTFKETATEFDNLLRKKWLESPFHTLLPQSWSSGPLQRADPPLDNWPELRALSPVPSDATVKDLILTMRHGLAHGNIYTQPTPDDRIKGLVFVSGGLTRSGNMKPYRYVYVCPADFRDFLLTWFDRLRSWHLSQEAVLAVLDALEQAA